jgi:hypothetical protein
METYPPVPRLVHPLPPAPGFVGREAELHALRSCWATGPPVVVALVGLGGAGKTAVAARFLEEWLAEGTGPRLEGVFVWSFYQEPDAGLFLRAAFDYFARGTTTTPARGAGLLHLLRDALSAGGPHLLVLDGLERVQHQQGDHAGAFGQVEDPLLRGLLTRLAEGAGRASALVTSRFPLTDLDPFLGRGYRPIEVGGLDVPSAVDLLRSRGVVGDDATLAGLVEGYGAHALTLDHLGGLIGQFLEGDPSRAPEAPALSSPRDDRQALHLARLLRAYEGHLPPAERAVLARLCLLRRSVGREQVDRLFLCTPAVQARTAREVQKQLGKLPDPDRQPLEEGLGLARPIRQAIEEALRVAPMAGPEEGFVDEVRRAVVQEMEQHQETVEADVEDLARLYGGSSLEPPTGREPLPASERLEVALISVMSHAPTDRRPLPASDRPGLVSLIARYRELRDHPLLHWSAPPAALEWALQKEGWWTPGRTAEDLGPEDVEKAFLGVRRRLHRLALKHFALLRVRELCRVRQRKWSLAGPLATLDAAALGRALEALIGRHLVLREADGSLSVHPAVRDHFARLAESPEAGGWHDLIHEQLLSLVRKPGRRAPEDRATLDIIEEAIHHALRAGRAEEASWLYEKGLGGLRHLGWKLGEAARGLRILRGFRTCPDRSALAWFLRTQGELDEAHAHSPLAYFRADVRLLQGRLPEVAAEGDSARAAIAAFLMGRTTELPPDLLGLSAARVQLLLYLGRHQQAWRTPQPQRLYKEIGWEGDWARGQLLLAEAARRQADLAGARELLEGAAGWVLRSGSVEHLGLWHLIRCRIDKDEGRGPAARRAADEGVHLSRQGGLRLLLVELLCARAEVLLSLADAAGAEGSAREAGRIASADDCQFAWGAAEAGHLLGQALHVQWRFGEARTSLEGALALRRLIGDPKAGQTERLLARLPS